MTNFQVYKKTLAFSFIDFGVGLLSLAALVGCCTAGYFIADNGEGSRGLIGLAIGFVLGIIIMIVAFNIKDMEAVGFWVMNHLEDIMIAMTIFAVVQAILYWGLSWYLFKRKDVVSLKWWK